MHFIEKPHKNLMVFISVFVHGKKGKTGSRFKPSPIYGLLYAAQSPMWFIGWFQHFMEILLAKDHFILLQPLTIQRKALCYVFFQDSCGPDT